MPAPTVGKGIVVEDAVVRLRGVAAVKACEVLYGM
jgi:hypothetical protein